MSAADLPFGYVIEVYHLWLVLHACLGGKDTPVKSWQSTSTIVKFSPIFNFHNSLF